MKRILFLLNQKPGFFKEKKLETKLKIKGVQIEYVCIKDLDMLPPEEKGVLLVTDSPSVFSYYKEIGVQVLVCIYNDSDFDLFLGATYFVMDPEEADYTYYLRVYQRIHELPWEMYQTKRLIVRETTESDVDAFYEMYKDSRMTEYMEPLYEDLEAERKYVKEYREKVYSCQGFGIWTLIRKSDGAVIGRAGLNYRTGFSEVEIGFAIGTDYWNEGYATEAILSILKFAKKEKLGAVNALVMSGNAASKHVLEKTGFSYKTTTKDGGKDYEVWCCLG